MSLPSRFCFLSAWDHCDIQSKRISITLIDMVNLLMIDSMRTLTPSWDDSPPPFRNFYIWLCQGMSISWPCVTNAQMWVSQSHTSKYFSIFYLNWLGCIHQLGSERLKRSRKKRTLWSTINHTSRGARGPDQLTSPAHECQGSWRRSRVTELRSCFFIFTPKTNLARMKKCPNHL